MSYFQKVEKNPDLESKDVESDIESLLQNYRENKIQHCVVFFLFLSGFHVFKYVHSCKKIFKKDIPFFVKKLLFSE